MLEPYSVIVIPTCSHWTTRLQQVQTTTSVVEEIVASNPPAPPCMTEKGASTLCTLKEPAPSWIRILYAYTSCSHRLRTWISALWTQTGNISSAILAGDSRLWNGAETLHSTAYFVFCNPLLHPILVSHPLHPRYNSHAIVTGLIRLAFVPEGSFIESILTFAAGNQSPVYSQEVLDISTQKSPFCRIAPLSTPCRTHPINYLASLRNTTNFSRNILSINSPLCPVSLPFFGRLSNFAY